MPSKLPFSAGPIPKIGTLLAPWHSGLVTCTLIKNCVRLGGGWIGRGGAFSVQLGPGKRGGGGRGDEPRTVTALISLENSCHD